ncbi:MAG: hypothetical protein WAV28_15150 [Sedimentisphaerales bacterium]
MKPLIVTIILAILTISLAGCTFVREYHRGYARHEVIVTHPRYLPTRPVRPNHPYAYRDMERHDYHRFRDW